MIKCYGAGWVLPVLFISFFLTACTEPDVVGLDLQPVSEQPGVRIDTLEVETYVAAEDSLVVWSPSKNLIELPTLFAGSYNDPYTGSTLAGFVSQIRIGNTITSGTFNGATSVDSIVLSILYRDINGDSTATHRLSVWELAEPLYNDSTYYSGRSYSRSNFLGHLDFVPEIRDSVVIGSAKSAPQMRIPLDTAFGGRLLRDYISNPNLFSGNTEFLNYFKGIVVVDSVDGVGSILSFPSTSGVHRLTVYFSGNRSYEFVIDLNAVRHAYFKHQYLLPLTDNVQDDLLVVQSMAGLKDSIKIVNPEKLIAGGPVSISSARLIFETDAATGTSNFQPHTNLLIFASDSTGKNLTTPDATESSGYYGGAYNTDTKSYTFNVARYLQRLLSNYVQGGQKDYGLFLVAGGSTSNARRTLLKGKSSVKLIVTSTKFNP